MKHHNWKHSLREAAGRHASRRGAFSAGLTALAVAAVLVFNLIAAQLPESWSQFDLSGSGIYDITDTSRDYLAAMEQDVEIHVLADPDHLDSRIVRFLDTYAELSDRLSLEYVDPIVYPSVLTQYGVDADTVVVTCAATGRQESFDISDIIGYDIMMYYMYGTQQETDFDGEGLLTSAIDSVVSGVTRTVYVTTGHGETALPAGVEERFDRVHMSVDSVNLLTDGGIPEDCSLLILNAPTEDLADDELEMILTYLEEGGQVANFSVAGDTAHICEASGKIAGFCRENRMEPRQVMRFSLAIEEVMTRIIQENPDTAVHFDVRVFSVQGTMGIRIRYDGRAYDPFDPRRTSGDAYLGIQLIAGMMEQVVYQRTFGVNTVQLLL